MPNSAIQRLGISEEEALRRQVAELERKIGQQTIQLDVFKRAFKRVKESRLNNGSTGRDSIYQEIRAMMQREAFLYSKPAKGWD